MTTRLQDGAAQAGTAVTFARKPAEELSEVRWEADNELPRPAGVPGGLACSVTREVEGGDHIVLFGRVEAASTATAPPLT